MDLTCIASSEGLPLLDKMRNYRKERIRSDPCTTVFFVELELPFTRRYGELKIFYSDWKKGIMFEILKRLNEISTSEGHAGAKIIAKKTFAASWNALKAWSAESRLISVLDSPVLITLIPCGSLLNSVRSLVYNLICSWLTLRKLWAAQTGSFSCTYF